MPSPQSCRTCRFFEPGSLKVVGACTWLPEFDLADSFTDWRMNDVMHADRGQCCPTWEQRAPDTESPK